MNDNLSKGFIVKNRHIKLLKLTGSYHEYKDTLTKSERILGITPGHFVRRVEEQVDPFTKNLVMVQGLLPNGPAINAGICIGDWLILIENQEVTSKNLNSILSEIEKNNLKQLHVTIGKVSMKKGSNIKELIPSKFHNAKIIYLTEKVTEDSKLNYIYGCIYLNMDIKSDNLSNNDELENVVYCFPTTQNIFLKNRGSLTALSSLMEETINNNLTRSVVLIGSQYICINFLKIEKYIFVIYLPISIYSIEQIDSIFLCIQDLLNLFFESLPRAFEIQSNKDLLNIFFEKIFNGLILSEKISDRKSSEHFFESINAARFLPLPINVKVIIDNFLSDFESSDFGDMSEHYYGCRRLYVINGSILYYKGYLLCSHVNSNLMVLIDFYLRLNQKSSHPQHSGTQIFWNELHLKNNKKDKYFLLTVSAMNATLAVVLEKGAGTDTNVDINTYNPWYSQQAKVTFLHFKSLGLFSLIDQILEQMSNPNIVGVDLFLKIPKNPLFNFSLPKFSKMFKPFKTPPISTDKLHRSGSTGSIYNPTTISEMSDRQLSVNNLNIEDDTNSLQTFNSKTMSVESLDSHISLNSHFLQNSKSKHNLPSIYQVTVNQKDYFESNIISPNLKLSSGCLNTVFTYCYIDAHAKVLMAPSREILNKLSTPTHKNVMRHFQYACLHIHTLFRTVRSTNSKSFNWKENCIEHGILFRGEKVEVKNSKKNLPVVDYWVVGHKMEQGEFYICFHDGAQQDVVEMALKFIQGMPIP